MEALVWVVDRGGVEPSTSVGTYYNGDVIIIKPDGWGWSAGELAESRWRVIRVPISQAQSDLYTAFSAKNVAGHQWKRQYKLNWSALTPPALAAKFVGPTDGQIIPLTVAQVQGIASLKANP